MKRQHITGFYVETLLLIVVFLAIILVLTQIFGLGKTQSRKAELLTNAVCLAQNAAEAVSASDSAEAVAALLDEGGNARMTRTGIEADYHADMSPDATGASDLTVYISWEPSGEDGRLVNSKIDVFASGEAGLIYSLDTAVYLAKEAAP